MKRALLVAALLVPGAARAGDLFSSIDAVAAELKAPDAARRRDAVDKLDAYGADEARPLLLRALGDGDPDVRAHAAASLGRHRVVEAVPRLTAALGDPDARLRAAAAEALGRVLEGPGVTEPRPEAARAAEALERALGDGEHEVREAAVEAIGRLPPRLGRRAAVAVTGRLDDESAGVRQRAAEVLGRLGVARAAVPLLARLGDPTREVRSAAVEALARLGDPRAVPALVRMLHDPADDVRGTAVTALGRLRATAAIVPLGELLEHGEPESLRSRAAFALGQIGAAPGGAAALDRLVAALDRDDLLMAAREALARVGGAAVPALLGRLPEARIDRATLYVDLLQAIGDRRATPALLDELERGRLPAERIVDALGAMLRAGDQRPLVPLVALLSAPSPTLRRHVAEALRGAVDGRATSVLAAAAADTDQTVRVIAIGELGRLGAREALPVLVRALGAGDEPTATAAAHALGQLGDRRAVEPLVAALGRSERPLRRAAGDALGRVADRSAAPMLMRAVRTAAPDRRASAIVALGGILRHRPDATARELLLGYAEGGDALAALAALDALGALGDRGALPRLERLVDRRGDVALRARALAAMGDIDADAAAHTLTATLAADIEPLLRAEAAWALGKARHPTPAALAALTAALGARSAAVRADAAAALYRLGRAPGALLHLLDDEDAAVRGNAALALSRTAGARAALGRMAAHDEDRWARAAAARAAAGAAPPARVDWIALDVVDFDGAALAGAAYRLVLPGGLTRRGVTDERGVVHEESVPRGACALVLDEAPAPR